MRKFKMFVLVLLLVLLIPFAVDTSFANGFGGGDRGGGWSGSGFHTGTQNTVLSYDALCDLCILVNEDIVMGVYDGVYPFSASSSITLAATVRYDSSSGYFVISCLYGGDYFNFRNASGGLFCSEFNPYSILSAISSRLSSVATKLDTIIDPYLNDIRRYVNNIGIALPTYVEQITTNAVANTTTMVEQITTNADANAAAIVDALDSTFDFTPVTERLDTLIAEVQKISTFDARHEVTTIIPGEFGNYETCVVRAGWEQIDDLKFLYNNTVVDYNLSSIYWDQIALIALSDACNGYNDYADYYYDTDWSYADHVLKFSWDSEVSYYSNRGNTPFVAEVYTYSDGLVGTYYSNSTEPFFISSTDFDYMHITMPGGAGRYFDYCGPGSGLMTVDIGKVIYPPAEEFNLTVDGRHGQYFFYGDLYGCIQNGWTLYYNVDDCQWQLESFSGVVYPFEYSDELTELFTPPDTTIVTLVGDIYTWFEWFYNEYANRGGLFDVTPIVNKLKDIEKALANMGSNIDIENNTNININEENENYNIFYVDDPDGGEDKSIVDLSGDTLKVFGKLLDFLYKVSFKGALDNAGSGIGDLSDFYLDTSEGSADLWAS